MLPVPITLYFPIPHLELIKHLSLRLLPNRPGLDFMGYIFPRRNDPLSSLGMCRSWEQEDCKFTGWRLCPPLRMHHVPTALQEGL